MNNKAKSNSGLLILIGIILACGILFYLGTYQNIHIFAVTGTETSVRILPAQIAPGATFIVTYDTTGTTPPTTLLVNDVITGGCTAGGLTEIKDLLIIKAGSTTKSVSYNVVAPATGSCTFTGHYAFGDAANVNYQTKVVTICSPSCADWSLVTDKCQTTKADGCGGTCTRTVTPRTPADTNCNNQVDENELKTYANKWIANQIGESELKAAAIAWING